MERKSQGRQKNRQISNPSRKTYAAGYARTQEASVSRGNYAYGSTARELDVVTALKEKDLVRISNSARRNREKAVHMNAGYVLFLCCALVLSGFILITYIRNQAAITTSIKNISSMESELNSLKLSNDEEYNRILSSVDLDEIKRIAIEELGMNYATADQIITYESYSSDYVRQLEDIHE